MAAPKLKAARPFRMLLCISTFAAVPLSGVAANRIESPDRQFPPRLRPPFIPAQCRKLPTELG